MTAELRRRERLSPAECGSVGATINLYVSGDRVIVELSLNGTSE
jgi:hypothetical protein